MSRTSNCIKMLQMLNSERTIKISEFAQVLETNPRNVIEYRKELEEVGYFIVSIPGREGGYRLERTHIFPSLKLDKDSKKALIESIKHINESKEFPYKKSYNEAMNVILSSFPHNNVDSLSTAFIERYPLSMSYEKLSERYLLLEHAIKSNLIVSIDYLSNDNMVRTRKIQPYTLYMYNNAWFVIAWCQLAHDFRYFKLCRIKDYQLLDQKFSKNKYYNEHEYLNKFGMTKNGDWYDVKLKFFGSAAMYVKDYLYGQNQVIEECDDLTTILSVKMQYKDNITKFVLGFGNECVVIEPEWLKNDVKKIVKEMQDNY